MSEEHADPGFDADLRLRPSAERMPGGPVVSYSRQGRSVPPRGAQPAKGRLAERVREFSRKGAKRDARE